MKYRGLRRFFNHVFSTPWSVERHFSKQALRNIEQAILASETQHTGEIRFVVEADLHPLHILYKKTPKKRALEVFSQYRVWDTEQNNGVLIYLLLADRDVEILADRGVHGHVGAEGWEAICTEMEKLFKKQQFEQGVLLGIEKIGDVLQQHYPSNGANENELPNYPIIL